MWVMYCGHLQAACDWLRVGHVGDVLCTYRLPGIG